ncbi:sodium/potassium-transporting ATPase subunit beta isoform X1 [Lepeophtheirus salmonis]|nr:sodium/potassium-transporting ATPase subunit beta-like isoform X1 [Lepeophtheirus salmonis]
MADNKPAANNSYSPPKAFQFAKKPEELSGWEGFKKFVWNTQTSEFLGRTGINWLKIILFYIVYYCFLTGYFIAMLAVFYQTLDDKIPKWKNSNGIIGNNPGLGYRPGPGPDKVESTLLKYRHGSLNGSGDWDKLVGILDTHIKMLRDLPDEEVKKQSKCKRRKYKGSILTGGNRISDSNPPDKIECEFDRLPGDKQICKIKIDDLITGPCTFENNYGFENGSPCILIKLNKIFDWIPKPFLNSTDFIKHGAPSGLVKYITKKEKENSPEVGNAVYIWCEGENPADREHIGHIDYYPSPGIPTYYFPYKNQEGYLSPAVFAHFKKPKHGVLISISCQAWAHDLKHNKAEREGTTHFELMID